MNRIIVTIEIDADRLFMGRPGRPGTEFDTGENGDEMKLALNDLANELFNIYQYANKSKEGK